jgi:hypothetical protein
LDKLICRHEGAAGRIDSFTSNGRLLAVLDDGKLSVRCDASTGSDDDTFVSIRSTENHEFDDHVVDGVSQSPDFHAIMVQRVTGCRVMSDLLADPSCGWVKKYYTLSRGEKEAFRNKFSEDDPHGFIGHLVLIPFEYIPPSMVGQIYHYFCSLLKDEQRGILLLCYLAKCWRENREYLRTDNFACYSPSYAHEDAAQLDFEYNTIYMNSFKVKQGINFGCARCCELSGMGFS